MLAVAELDLGQDRLSSKDRRRAEHFRKKLVRQSETAARTALSAYGSAFARNWNSSTLYDTACAAGLKKEYDFYRVASAISHSSSGGVLGIHREIGGRDVHRTGPALALVPVSLLHGTRHFLALCEAEVGRIGHGSSCEQFLDALRLIDDAWLEFSVAVDDLDAALWPQEPPLGAVAVLEVMPPPYRKRRWWLHDLATGRVIRALDPDVTSEMLDELLRFIKSTDSAEALERNSSLTIGVPGVIVHPRPGELWRSDAELFDQRSLQMFEFPAL